MLFSLSFIEELLAVGKATLGSINYSLHEISTYNDGGVVFTDGEFYFYAWDYDGDWFHCKPMTYNEYSYIL